MKTINYMALIMLLASVFSCEIQEDSIEAIGEGPSNGSILIDESNPYKPIFTVSSDNGFIYHWDMGNGQKLEGKEVTSYYAFSGTYNVTCIVYGAGAKNIVINQEFNVGTTDPSIANQAVWKELTGSGLGKTWVYDTNTETGVPSYCYQTTGDLETYPEGWTLGWGWGQCVGITPDIKGEMIFDLNGGINYTYHQTASDTGIKGTFILDAENLTLTIVDPYILDHDIDCTNTAATSKGVYNIKLLTDDQMVLWQNQGNGTGWSWRFKRKE